MENTTKITKTMVLEAIKANAMGLPYDGQVTEADVINYVETTLAQLDKKAANAKAKAAEKKAAGDELRAAVKAVLTNELQTREQVFAQIEGDDSITLAKVGARLTQLVSEGSVVKESIKTETGKKMAYKLATEVE